MGGLNKTQKIEELIKQYSSCLKEQTNYETDSGKYTVTRHFTCDKDINQVVSELAEIRAGREMGLS
ncbi:MAG: hypothetical protein J1G07_01570 [Clostridiales bacterium]|nr:hypothetical protein [Clostridiales bacterium]